MPQLSPVIDRFIQMLRNGSVVVYNEFSLQHELGIHFREALPEAYLVQFERPVTFFGCRRVAFQKKEIDISVFTPDKKQRSAVELKFPRNGQYPEQMFKACEDIAFLEQLVEEGFSPSYFLMLADDPLFYEGAAEIGIYRHFRAGQPISGLITKPTGKKDQSVNIRGPHVVRWFPVRASLRYALLQIPH